jgi:hypothetical protein
LAASTLPAGSETGPSGEDPAPQPARAPSGSARSASEPRLVPGPASQPKAPLPAALAANSSK